MEPEPDRWRPEFRDPRRLRPRSTNRRAALALLAGIAVVIVLLALFT